MSYTIKQDNDENSVLNQDIFGGDIESFKAQVLFRQMQEQVMDLQMQLEPMNIAPNTSNVSKKA